MDGGTGMAAGIPLGTKLSPEDWNRAQEVFLALLELCPEDRPASLLTLCAGQHDLQVEVVRLLAGHEAADAIFGAAIEENPPLPWLLGAYRLVEEIGSGGMGTVYRAERADGQFEKQVAVKVLSPDTLTPRAVARFRNERQILAELDHPYIARLMDGGVTGDGRPYLVMEYVDGVPVDRYCRDRELGQRQIAEVAARAAAAVAYAHDRGVVHRDLKPGNLLITADGTPKLLDFGISQLMGQAAAGRDGAEESTLALTPDYASPEQLAGGTATPASDVYSLGVLLRGMLAGRTTRDLDAIVRKATATEPAKRYASGNELRADLERYLNVLPVTARPRAVGVRVGKFLRRRRWQVAACVLLTVAVGAAAVARYETRVTTARKVEEVKAIHAMYWENYRRIAGLAGSADARMHLAGQTLEQLASVERSGALDGTLLVELAKGYAVVGSSQGSGAYSLGNLRQAEKTLLHARELAERAVVISHDFGARRMFSGVLTMQASSAIWNEEFARAEDIAVSGQAFMKANRTQFERAGETTTWYMLSLHFANSLGDALDAEGKPELAAETMQAADDLRPPKGLSDAAILDAQYGLKRNLALHYCRTAEPDRGDAYARQAEAISRRFTQMVPWRRAMMVWQAVRAVGECQLTAGRYSEARVTIESARSAYDAELARQPGEFTARTGLAEADRLLGAILLRTGDLRGAVKVLDEGLDSLRASPGAEETGIAEVNSAVLRTTRAQVEQRQAAESLAGSPLAARYMKTACQDYRGALAIMQEHLRRSGLFLDARNALAAAEKELPKCAAWETDLRL
jgi:tetratricopeptide (TPR) repeat protein